MKIGQNASLRKAAARIERRLLIAAQEGDVKQVDTLLDMLRALETISELETAAPCEVVKAE